MEHGALSPTQVGNERAPPIRRGGRHPTSAVRLGGTRRGGHHVAVRTHADPNTPWTPKFVVSIRISLSSLRDAIARHTQ